MTKEYYQILGVSESATLEEIKKSFRKLAQQWHPDKFATKILAEKEKANERMRDLNKAYEILGDEDKRKRYDLGETNFNDFSDDSQKAAWEAKEEEIRKKEELLKEMRESAGLMREEAEIMEEMWLLNADYIDRFSTVNEISATFGFSFPRVFKEDLDSKFNKLWDPYESWLKKVWEMPITISKSKERSDELQNFKEEMIKAIKETEVVLENKQKNKEKERNNSKISQERLRVIEIIEREISEKSLKVEDLEKKFHNYKQDINSLDKFHKIRALRDVILLNISNLARKKGKEKDRSSPQMPNQPKERKEEEKLEEVLNGFRGNKYDNWTREELVEEIYKEQLNNASLQKLISLLQTKIQELEQEIAELKAEIPQTPEIQREIERRKTQLRQSRIVLNSIVVPKNTEIKPDNNPLPIIPIFSVISIISLLGLITYKVKKNKIKK